MAIPQSHYTAVVINDLLESTEYEAWLLEAVYDVAGHPIAVTDNDNWIYPANGAAPTPHNFATGKIIVGDWKPKFLEVGLPLVFASSFKILDMIVEWVLRQNVMNVPFQFSQKLPLLTPAVVFPSLIQNRSWLRDRLIALYKELAPLRNTVIHTRNFQSTNGRLSRSSQRF